jgi:hypothetical protein
VIDFNIGEMSIMLNGTHPIIFSVTGMHRSNAPKLISPLESTKNPFARSS